MSGFAARMMLLLVGAVAALASASCAAPARLPASAEAGAVRDARIQSDLRRVAFLPAPDNPNDVIAVTNVFADAAETLRIVRELYPVTAAFEAISRHMVVRGKREDVEGALALVHQLEEREVKVTGRELTVFTKQLKTAKARQLAATLNSLIAKGFYARGWVTADERTNTVVVCIDTIDTDRLKNIMDELDRSVEPLTRPAEEIRIEGRNLAPSIRP